MMVRDNAPQNQKDGDSAPGDELVAAVPTGVRLRRRAADLADVAWAVWLAAGRARRCPRAISRDVPGIGPKLSQKIAAANDEIDAEAEIADAEPMASRSSLAIIQPTPRSLAEIRDPPAVLFMQGTIEPSDALGDRDRRLATRHSLWPDAGRAIGRQPGAGRLDDRQRPGARASTRRPIAGPCRRRANAGRDGQRRAQYLSAGKSRAGVRRSPARRAGERSPAARRAAQRRLPAAKSDHQRHVACRAPLLGAKLDCPFHEVKSLPALVLLARPEVERHAGNDLGQRLPHLGRAAVRQDRLEFLHLGRDLFRRRASVRPVGWVSGWRRGASRSRRSSNSFCSTAGTSESWTLTSRSVALSIFLSTAVI